MMDIAERFVVALNKGTDRLINDLEAIPEDLRRVSPGGGARSPYSVAIECAFINTRIAAAISGEEVPPSRSFDEYELMLEHLPTFQSVAEFIRHETLVLTIAVKKVDPAVWDEVAELIPGRPPMTRFDAVLLTLTHMAYHDGQLNYVHLLHGDTKIHW